MYEMEGALPGCVTLAASCPANPVSRAARRYRVPA
jgi:hypothetical protein